MSIERICTAAVDASPSRSIPDSIEGRQLCREVAHPALKYHPHDSSYSLDVAVQIIEGKDCLVRAACGSGKTGINSSLCSEVWKRETTAPPQQLYGQPCYSGGTSYECTGS